MKSVIILDGEENSALCAVRSLGRAQRQTLVGAKRATAPALHSRFVTRRFTYADPQQDPKGFIKTLRTQLRTLPERPVVLAFSDTTQTLIEQYRAELEPLIYFSWNTPDALEIINNKAATYSEAKLLGVSVTPTFLLENAGEVRRRSVDWEFPVVVKSRRSVSWQLGVGVPGTTCFIHDIEELITVFTMIKQQTSESPLIQPLVRGERYEVELLCHEGVALAEVIHHSLRTISPTSSVSVLRETISSDETELSRELSRVAHKVAKALSWQGPLVVEFKVDADTHIPFLIKINGRFSGVLPLAGFAGVNFPLLYATQLQGNFFEAALITSRPSVVSRYWLGDAQHLLRVWLFRSTTLPHVYPTRRKALRDFFRAYRGVYFDVWQWTDPLPALWQYIDAVNKH